jgi:hypothetical protein
MNQNPNFKTKILLRPVNTGLALVQSLAPFAWEGSYAIYISPLIVIRSSVSPYLKEDFTVTKINWLTLFKE